MMRGYHTLSILINDTFKGSSVNMRVFLVDGINVVAVFYEKHDPFNWNTCASYHRSAAHNVFVYCYVFVHRKIEQI